MPTADDTEIVASPSEQPKKSDANDTVSNEDWHKRYNGQTGLINKLKDQQSAAAERYEAELADLRSRVGGVDTLKSTLEKQINDLTKERDGLTERLTGREKADALKKEYPNVDDITLAALSPKLFADDAAYKAHLKALNDKLASPSSSQQQVSPANADATEDPADPGFVGYRSTNYLDQLAGIVPNAPVQKGERTKGGGKRTVQQIQAEMNAQDTKTQVGQQKFDALLREMDTVLG